MRATDIPKEFYDSLEFEVPKNYNDIGWVMLGKPDPKNGNVHWWVSVDDWRGQTPEENKEDLLRTYKDITK